MSDHRPRYIDTADPSWYPIVLRRLADDYPEISDTVWGDAISDNARKLTTRRTEQQYVESISGAPRLVDGPGCTPAVANEDQERGGLDMETKLRRGLLDGVMPSEAEVQARLFPERH